MEKNKNKNEKNIKLETTQIKNLQYLFGKNNKKIYI